MAEITRSLSYQDIDLLKVKTHNNKKDKEEKVESREENREKERH